MIRRPSRKGLIEIRLAGLGPGGSMLPWPPEFAGEEASSSYVYILQFRTTLCTSRSAVRKGRRSSCHRNELREAYVPPLTATSGNARFEAFTSFEPAKLGRTARDPAETNGR